MIIFVQFDSSTAGAPAGFFTAVNAAVEYWERALINPLQVTITFGYGMVDGQPIDSGALAESESFGNTLTYSQVKAALSSHATSASDLSSVSHLPSADPTGGAGYFVTIAEEEALGLHATGNTQVGFAGLSTAFAFSFDPLNRAVSGKFDAIGAMEHEISEVLGRIAGGGVQLSGVAQFSPLDLFRYVSAGTLATDPNATNTYFSIDGGTTHLLPFNDATSGNDAGDWSVSGDAFGFGAAGSAGLVSPTDLMVMDALGYTLAPDPNARNDFNSDGVSSFLIQNTNGGIAFGEVANGQAAYTFPTALDSSWSFKAHGDFLGTGGTQFLIENTNGTVDVGQLFNHQASYTQISGLDSSWKIVGAGDFLGLADGDQYLLFNTSGLVAVGNAESGQAVYSYVANLPAGWSFVGAGDFFGDGKSDFMIQTTAAAGTVAIGEVANGGVTFTFPTALDSSWKFVGTGDFLNDGKDQFMIQNTGGLVAIGEVSGGHANFIFPTQLASQWKFVGDGDYLANGHDQFLIESSTSGAVFVGDYTGGQVHYTQISTLPSTWLFH